jgi:hypothetical protein
MMVGRMNESDQSQQVRLTSAKLSRRDWILLPAVGLFTIVFLASLTELIAREMYPRLITKGEDCIVKDPVTGARGIPHSVCWEKIPEGELTQYRFNSSGYRSDEDFGSKLPGTYRIVMMGTSFTIGMLAARGALAANRAHRRTVQRSHPLSKSRHGSEQL